MNQQIDLLSFPLWVWNFLSNEYFVLESVIGDLHPIMLKSAGFLVKRYMFTYTKTENTILGKMPNLLVSGCQVLFYAFYINYCNPLYRWGICGVERG